MVARSIDLGQHAGLPCPVGSVKEDVHGDLQSLDCENLDCDWCHPPGHNDHDRSQGHHLAQGAPTTKAPCPTQEVA